MLKPGEIYINICNCEFIWEPLRNFGSSDKWIKEAKRLEPLISGTPFLVLECTPLWDKYNIFNKWAISILANRYGTFYLTKDDFNTIVTLEDYLLNLSSRDSNLSSRDSNLSFLGNKGM